jgi:hypothetical protein
VACDAARVVGGAAAGQLRWLLDRCREICSSLRLNVKVSIEGGLFTEQLGEDIFTLQRQRELSLVDNLLVEDYRFSVPVE